MVTRYSGQISIFGVFSFESLGKQRDKRNLKKMRFSTESIGAKLRVFIIKYGLFKNKITKK